jgi:hypothetical protein
MAGVRNHLLNFPDDPLARAAHRLERVLPVFAGRVILAEGRPDLDGIARDMQGHWSDELKARARIDGDRLYIEMVLHMTDSIWRSIPWTASVLNDACEQFEQSLDLFEVNQSRVTGLVGDPHFEWHYNRDMLMMGTLYELGSMIPADHLDDEIIGRLKVVVAHDDDEMRMVAPARSLIEAYEGADR